MISDVQLEKVGGTQIKDGVVRQYTNTNNIRLVLEEYTNKNKKYIDVEIVNLNRSATAIEMEFVVDALPVKLIGMNLAMMCATTSNSVPINFPSASVVIVM